MTAPTVINADNTGAIALAQNPTQSIRTRHIDFQYHYTREKIADGSTTIEYVPTADMIAVGISQLAIHSHTGGLARQAHR